VRFVLSKQTIEFVEGHTTVLARNFTQHSAPFKHDAAEWARDQLRDYDLRPLLRSTQKRVAHAPAERKRSAASALAAIPSTYELRKTFIKERSLARDKRFALMLAERFCDDE
jgi:hypothetical protein